MSRLLPFQSETEVPEDRAPRVVDLDGEDAEQVFSALSSETAREIFTSLHDEPRTASDIAEAVDSSIQNVRYHIENLSEAGLVEVVDTWYSSRGNEMKVYAPRDGPLIVSGDESKASRLRTALSRLVGGVGVLAAASLLVQYASRELFFGLGGTGSTTEGGAPASGDGGSGGADGGDAAVAEPENLSGDATTGEAGGGDGGMEIQDAETTTTDGGGLEGDATATVTDGGTDTAAPTHEPTTVEHAAQTMKEPTGTAAQDGGGTEYAMEATETVARTATDVARESGGAGLFDGGLPPGALFFLGGLVVLLALVAYQYRAAPYR